MIFIDYTNAFGTVNREVLWNILWKLGSRDHIVKLVTVLHTGMTALVTLRGEFSEPFEVGNGVKEGRLLALILLDFSFYGLV